MKTVKALSGFWVEGQLVTKGETIEVSDGLANELITANKAIVVTVEKAEPVVTVEKAEPVDSIGE